MRLTKRFIVKSLDKLELSQSKNNQRQLSLFERRASIDKKIP